MPVLPAYAADNITVYVNNYNSISKELEVYVKSASESFAGAEITLDKEETVGVDASYILSASGKGFHLALIDVASVTKDGEFTLKVVSDCGESELEVDTKVINLARVAVEKTEYGYETLDVKSKIDSDTSKYEKVDSNTVKINFLSSANLDYRLGWGNDGTGGTVNTEGKNLNPSGGNLILEYEVMFRNGSDSETLEKPEAYFNMSFRQDRNKSVQSGYPTNTATGTGVGNDFPLFNSNGKIDGSGEEYKTNIWYKCRLVFDMVTTNASGELVGGVTFLVAKEGANGYGNFEVQKQQANYLLNNLRHFRFNPRPSSDDCSIFFKNISLTREEPLKSWYFEGASYNGKVNIVFSEDMGELKIGDIKLLNTVKGDEIEIASVTRVDTGKYEITTKRDALNFGREYEVFAKNALVSAGGAYAFAEPEEDADGDGFWKLGTFEAPKFALNVASVSKSSSKVDVKFNNTDISGALASVCWYDAEGFMVDCVIAPVIADVTQTQTFMRKTEDAASKIKVIIFELKEGADKVFEVYED